MSPVEPLVSVVSAAYNGEKFLEESLRSVLQQDMKDLELIVVDDGSWDATGRILTELESSDPRVRIIRQKNEGLTAALATGCAIARGTYVARHDSDDISLPGRFRLQAEFLSRNPLLSLVSCFSYVIGPEAELLLEEDGPVSTEEATEALENRGRGPNGHGSAMFRLSDYQAVGGYRMAFRFAQDWDLWLRLADCGSFAFVPEYLYAYRFQERSISASKKEQQQQLFWLAREARAARKSGASEARVLERAAVISRSATPAGADRGSPGGYFIGKCLLDRRDRRAIGYLGRCAKEKPFSARIWAAWAAARLFCHREGCTIRA